jgi:hypothetical protein
MLGLAVAGGMAVCCTVGADGRYALLGKVEQGGGPWWRL